MSGCRARSSKRNCGINNSTVGAAYAAPELMGHRLPLRPKTLRPSDSAGTAFRKAKLQTLTHTTPRKRDIDLKIPVHVTDLASPQPILGTAEAVRKGGHPRPWHHCLMNCGACPLDRHTASYVITVMNLSFNSRM